ncbi:hypothetical protein PHISP_07412 [Aspergillus sp. HF37]|nr:hypothetical protein PHISP_07412 [Aspergillus sp. HF37]
MPSANGSDKVPRLRRKKSWIGRPRSQGTSQYAHAKSTSESTADELNANDQAHTKGNSLSQATTAVSSEGTVPEYHDKKAGDFDPANDAKAAKDVVFESISNDPKLIKTRSRGLGRFFWQLRHQKPQRLGSSEEGSGCNHGIDGGVHDGSTGGTENSTQGRYHGTSSCDVLGRFGDGANGNSEHRNISEQTAVSQNSDTAATIYRHPSKRASAPITILDRDYAYENPFEGVRESSQPGPECNPFTDEANISSQSTWPGSSIYSDHVPGLQFSGMLLDRPKNPIAASASFDSRSFSTGGSFQTDSMRGDSGLYALSGDSRWSDRFSHPRAAEAFNELAGKLHLQPLVLNDDNQPVSGEEWYEPAAEETNPKRRDRVFGRMRVMRSSLSMRAQAMGQERGLRRMKTFASLPSRPTPMDSLRGKSLMTLSRLGGHSFLELPGDFAPGPLKLPACFVLMARYLRSYAPTVRNAFFDAGDAKKAGRLYDYFANQVLAAEKEKDQIEMTMRSSNMPSGLEALHLGKPEGNGVQVHNAASVFKALLGGLPGGILGSRALYRALVEVYYAQSSEGDLRWMDGCLGAASVMDSAKVAAMAQAMAALTGGMRLELICGVFGECALLLYETEMMRATAEQQQGQGGGVGNSFLSGRMTLDRLARVFGPLLLAKTQTEDSGDSYGQVEREIEQERVASMVIGQWRHVSRQLRGECQGRRRRGYRLESWGERVYS